MNFFDDIVASMSGANAQGLAALSSGQRYALDLNAADALTDLAGNAIGAVSHSRFGQQARESADFQAAQLRQNAGEAQASSQRAAFDIDRQTQIVNSHALAVAAASGGGASDPTVVNLIARNAGEGAYRKAVALYQGDERARLMNLQATAKEYEGRNVAANSNLVAAAQGLRGVGSLMQGYAKGASMYERFGGGGVGSGGPGSSSWGMDLGKE